MFHETGDRFGWAARTADDGGSGLGLAIVRDIVTMHGGTITVLDGTTPPMTGASMVIRLPLQDSDPVTETSGAGRAAATLDSAPEA